jgi:hypothetical protein
MSQVAKDYQQVSPGLGLSPSFVNPTSAPLEDRGGDQDFFHLFRRDGMSSDMVNAFKRPFKVVDSHGQSQTAIMREVDELNVRSLFFRNGGFTPPPLPPQIRGTHGGVNPPPHVQGAERSWPCTNGRTRLGRASGCSADLEVSTCRPQGRRYKYQDPWRTPLA